MKIRYGDTIREKSSNHGFRVRAVAPGACVVLGPILHQLNEPCPIGALSIIHPDELDEFYELVKE